MTGFFLQQRPRGFDDSAGIRWDDPPIDVAYVSLPATM
jgi:hypothetical protein